MNLYNYLLDEIAKLETQEYNDLFRSNGGYGAGILSQKDIETLQVIKLMVQDLPSGEYWQGVKDSMGERLSKMQGNYDRYWIGRQEAARRVTQWRNEYHRIQMSRSY